MEKGKKITTISSVELSGICLKSPEILFIDCESETCNCQLSTGKIIKFSKKDILYKCDGKVLVTDGVRVFPKDYIDFEKLSKSLTPSPKVVGMVYRTKVGRKNYYIASENSYLMGEKSE